MQHYKDIKAFERRITNSPDWGDYFKLGGRMYNIYEYGPGIGVSVGYSYCYWRNKRTGNLVYVKYILPTVQYIDGQRVERGRYSLLEVELQEGVTPWR